MKKKITIISLALCFLVMAGMFAANENIAEATDDGSKEIIDAGEQTVETIDGVNKGGVIHFEDLWFGIKADSANSKLRSATAVPAKYDPRADKRILIKNQNPTGLCWAFAATTVAEREYLGDTSRYTQLSPAHLGYFFYNRVNDPLGNTAEDRNVLPTGENYTTVGGNSMFTFQALANWTGLALESTAPFNGGYPAATFDSSLAYQNAVTLESAEVLDRSSEVKNAVLQNGGVIVDYYYNYSYSYRGDKTYYCPYELTSNHEVTIVGWDDNYSKANFDIPPSQNGAWLVQNSWGTSFADGGYFYMSYEDKSLGNAVSLDVRNSAEYDYNYQYDGNAYPASILFSAGEKVANIYRASGNQELSAVGFTTWNWVSTSYNVKVYSNVTYDAGTNILEPDSGTMECSFDVMTDNAGYYTFELPEDVLISKDSNYSIIITASRDTDFGAEVDISAEDSTDCAYEAGFAEDQSYWCSDSGTWYDLYDNEDKSSIRIKGFANELEGWYTLDGSKSYYQDGVKVTGLVTIGSYNYYFNTQGQMQTGIQNIEGIDYYFSTVSGKMLKSKWLTIDDSKYYVKKNGQLAKGLITIGSYNYCFNDRGQMQKGIQAVNGIDYCFSTKYGRMYISKWLTIDGEKYYASKTGKLLKGLYTIGSYKYYFNDQGKRQSGIRWISGNGYYFSTKDGKMLKSRWLTVGGKKYYINKYGNLVTGLRTIGSYKYYFNNQGQRQTGIQWTGGNGYYFSTKDGKMLKSRWLTIDGKKYYVNKYGRLIRDLAKIGSYKYYFNAQGQRQTGIQEVDGVRYYFDSSKYDRMSMSKWITVGEDKYYATKTGILKVGYAKIGSYYYYFNQQGKMQKGEVEVDGATKYFSETTGREIR